MKCIDCGKSIDWDNSYGHSENTCVCYACLMKRAGSYDLLGKTLNKLINWGIQYEAEKLSEKKSKKPLTRRTNCAIM